jgi:TPR repeat protein
MAHRMASLLLAAAALGLTGCVGAAIEGAATAKDVSARSKLEPEAAAGNAVAQFKLGNSYCCTLTDRDAPVANAVRPYDNRKATEWLCKAARQDYGPAEYKLALIYSGDPMGDKFRLLRRGVIALREFVNSDANLPIAALWARRAAAQNVSDAAKLASSLSAKLTPQQIQYLEALQQDWQTAPCTWDEVLGQQ